MVYESLTLILFINSRKLLCTLLDLLTLAMGKLVLSRAKISLVSRVTVCLACQRTVSVCTSHARGNLCKPINVSFTTLSGQLKDMRVNLGKYTNRCSSVSTTNVSATWPLFLKLHKVNIAVAFCKKPAKSHVILFLL